MAQDNLHKSVLLIKPNYPGHYKGVIYAGMGYIAEVFEQNGINYQMIDLEFGYKLNQVLDRIKQFESSLIGVSMMTFKFKSTYQLITAIKTAYPKIKIVVGGPHVSTMREEVLQSCKALDFGVIYEGEMTMLELCQGQPQEGIKGLIYRNGEEIVYTGDRTLESNLDVFPFPKYRNFELHKYSGAVPLVSSRGCPYSCIYCHVKNVMGSDVRLRSVTNFVDEIEYWSLRGKRRLGIADDNFTFNRNHVIAICEEILSRNLTGLNLILGNGVRADRVDRELLKIMKTAGFGYISFGVEGGNDKVLKSLKKGERMETIQQAVADACELGYDVGLHFVVGAPEETWNDIAESFAIVKKYPVYEFAFNNLIPYPKTALYNWVEKNKYFTIPPSTYFNDVPYWKNEPVFETPIFSLEERKRAIREALKLNTEVKIRYFKHKFKKYGFVGRIIAYIVAMSFVRDKLLKNVRVKKVILKIYESI